MSVDQQPLEFRKAASRSVETETIPEQPATRIIEPMSGVVVFESQPRTIKGVALVENFQPNTYSRLIEMSAVVSGRDFVYIEKSAKYPEVRVRAGFGQITYQNASYEKPWQETVLDFKPAMARDPENQVIIRSLEVQRFMETVDVIQMHWLRRLMGNLHPSGDLGYLQVVSGFLQGPINRQFIPYKDLIPPDLEEITAKLQRRDIPISSKTLVSLKKDHLL